MTGLSAAAVSSSRIDLDWSAPTDNVGVTGYRVERCQGVACSNFAQIAAPAGPLVSDNGLTPSTSYSYRVRATDAAGNLGTYSNTATTLSSPPGNGDGVNITPASGGLTLSQTITFSAAVVNDPGSAGVAWTASGGTLSNQSATSATFSSSTPGSFTITATSLADSTKSASATIGVTDLAGVFTYHNDAQRTGLNAQEYVLSPSNLSSTAFGKLYSCALDTPGYVYAEPLYVANLTMGDGKTHNVLFVATESDWVYAFDADSGACQQFWKARVFETGEATVPPADTGETNDLVPEIGVTSTPVIDPATSTIYVSAKAKAAGPVYHHRLYALDLVSGARKLGSPVEITAPNFVPLAHLQRPALLLDHGTVYIAFGSHGDHNIYQGWLMAYDATTLARKFAWASTDPTSGNQGAIWQAGNGPSADSDGNVYVETANGLFDGVTNYSDSVVKLSPSGSVLDSFTPFDQSTISAADVDLGSSGTIVLPDALGSASHPHLALATGKPGTLYLLDRDNLGGFNPSGDQVLQEVAVVPANTMQPLAGVFGQPAIWNGNVYVAAVGTPLMQFGIANGALSLVSQSQSANSFGLRGVTPAASANGSTNGIVWALDISAYANPPATSGPAVLYAYDAANLANVLYASPASGAGAAGKAVKFTVPTVANGKVYVGGQASLTVFGFLNSAGTGVLFTDDFNRPDANPAGGNWANSNAGGGRIVGNQLAGGVVGDNFAFVNTVPPLANQYAKVTFVSTANSDNDLDNGGPMVRSDSSANGWLLDVQSNNPAGDTTWILFRVNLSHGTPMTTGKLGRALVNGDVLEIRAIGNLITGYLNGVAIPGATTADTTFPTGGFSMHLFSNTGKWDNFEGGSL